MVKIENILLEVFGILLITLLAYGTCSYYSFLPVYKAYSGEKSTLIFCAIPASFYVVARIYFGVAFLILDKTVPSKFKKYGIISMLFLLSNYIVSAIVILLPVLHPLMLHFTEWIASIALLSAALIGLYYQPTVKSQLHAIYETSVGGIADVLYEVCKPEIIKAYEFGLKFAGLLFGWFLLLFAVELVLTLLMVAVSAAVRKLFGRTADPAPSPVEQQPTSE